MKTNEKVRADNNELRAKILNLWEEYALYYEKTFGKISVFQGFAKKLGEYLLPVPEGIVLDGGCGPGLHFERIIQTTRAKSLVGLDYSPEMLIRAEKSRERLNGKYDCEVKIVQADLFQRMPFPENYFDAQLYHLVLYYLPSGEWKNVLREAFRVAKPGGYIVTTNVLSRFDFKKELVFLLKDMFLHLKAIMLFMVKVKPILTSFQDLEQKGIIGYPTRDELVHFHRQLGFERIETQYIWKDNTMMIRAHKPV